MALLPPPPEARLWVRARLNEVSLAVVFLTRLPWAAADWRPSLMSAAWAFPLAGALLGLICGGVAATAVGLGMTPLLAAILGLAAMMLGTGCLHEDGLGDTADGIGSGRDPARSLEILRDSRIGTYGLVAILLAVLVRIAALMPLLTAGAWGVAVPAWITAAALGRGVGPLFSLMIPPARADGVGAGAGRPTVPGVVVALLLPMAGGIGLAAAAGQSVPLTLLALLAALTPLPWLGRLACRRLGGYTGDVIGAAILAVECAALVLLSAAWTKAPVP